MNPESLHALAKEEQNYFYLFEPRKTIVGYYITNKIGIVLKLITRTGIDHDKIKSLTDQWVSKFIELNKEVFDTYQPIKKIGSGSYGDAWKTKDDLVMKIFTGQETLKFYEKQMDNVYDKEAGSSQTLMVHACGSFISPSFPEKPDQTIKLSWAVMEKLKPYDKHMLEMQSGNYIEDKPLVSAKYEFDNLYGEILNYVRDSIYLGALKKPKMSTADIDIAAKQIYNSYVNGYIYHTNKLRIQNATDKLNMPETWLYDTIRAMTHQIINETGDDLHSGNIGLRRDDTPIYFDPFVSSENPLYDDVPPDIVIDKWASKTNKEDYEFSYLFQDGTNLRSIADWHFTGMNNPHREQWKRDFIELNQHIFLEYRPKKLLGSGAYGDVWSIGSGQVLKIAEGHNILQFYKEEYDTFNNPDKASKYALRIYDYGKLKSPKIHGEHHGTPRFAWAVMEELVPFEQKLQQNPDFINVKKEDAEQDHIDRFFDIRGVIQDIKTYIQREFRSAKKEISNVNELTAFAETLYQKYIKDYSKYLTENAESLQAAAANLDLPPDWIYRIFESTMYQQFRNNQNKIRNDIHAGNLGFRGNSTPVYFDPSALVDNNYFVDNSDIIDIAKKNAASDYNFWKIFEYTTIYSKLRNAAEWFFEDRDELSDAITSWIYDFFFLNDDIFLKYPPGKKLGSGSYGDAWEIADGPFEGKVLKLTSGTEILNYFKQEQDSVFDPSKGNKHNLMIYDYGQFKSPTFKNNKNNIVPLAWAVMERLEPFFEKERKHLYNLDDKNISGHEMQKIMWAATNASHAIQDFVLSEIHKNPQIQDVTPDKLNFVLDDLYEKFLKSREYQMAINDIALSQDKLNMPSSWIKSFLSATFIERSKNRQDLHTGNIGFRTNDTALYYDPTAPARDLVQEGYTEEDIENFYNKASLRKDAQSFLTSNPILVAKFVKGIIDIMIGRMSPESQVKAYPNIHNKIKSLNVSDIHSKKTPGGAAIGVSISLIKNILNGRDPMFINAVLDELQRSL